MMSHRWPWAVVSAALLLLLLLCASAATTSAAWLDALSVSSSSQEMTSPDYSAVLSSPSSSSSSSSSVSASPSSPPPPLLPGFTRSLVGLDYALIAPESRTWSTPIESNKKNKKHKGPSWSKASVAHLISPGRGGGGAAFSMSLVKLGPAGSMGDPPAAPGAQRFLFVLDGVIKVEIDQEERVGKGQEAARGRRRRQRCLPRKGKGGGFGFSGGSNGKSGSFQNLTLGADGFAFFPPHCRGFLPSVTAGPGGAGLLVFERIHVDRETGKPSVPSPEIDENDGDGNGGDGNGNGSDDKCAAAVDEGDLPFFVWGPSASKLPLLDPGFPETFKLRKLLPHDVSASPGAANFDFNVHLMDFDPGEFLVTKEVHHNQHGLLMLLGQGVYRLSNDVWFPVGAGDAIYMGPYVTQWFGALAAPGGGFSRYILFKDTAPDPLLAARSS